MEFACSSGLRVAYLSGKYIPDVYKTAKGAQASGGHFEDDVDALRAIADDKDVVDILLSYPLSTVSPSLIFSLFLLLATSV